MDRDRQTYTGRPTDKETERQTQRQRNRETKTVHVKKLKIQYKASADQHCVPHPLCVQIKAAYSVCKR